MDALFPVEPMIEDYQLIGDSQLLRLSEKYLNCRRRGNRLGLCVSGQTISELYNGIFNQTYPLSFKIICLIGTNDLTKNTGIEDMIAAMSALVRLLIDERHVQQLILLTVPPVPRLATSKSHWNRLQIFNSYISSLANGTNITVVEIHDLFLAPMDPPPRCDTGPGGFSQRMRMRMRLPSPTEDKIHANQTQLFSPKFNQPFFSSSHSLEIKLEPISNPRYEKSSDFKSSPQNCVISSSGFNDRNPSNSPFDRKLKLRCEANFLSPQFMKEKDFRHLQPEKSEKPERIVQDMWNVESIKPKSALEKEDMWNVESIKPKNALKKEDMWNDKSFQRKSGLEKEDMLNDKSVQPKGALEKEEMWNVKSMKGKSALEKEGVWNVGSIKGKTALESGKKLEKEVDTSDEEPCVVENLLSNTRKIREKAIGADLTEKLKKTRKIMEECCEKLEEEELKELCPVEISASRAPKIGQKPIGVSLLDKQNKTTNISCMKHGDQQNTRKPECEGIKKNLSQVKSTGQNNKGSEASTPSLKPSKTKNRYYDSYEKHGESPKINHVSPKRESTADESCVSGTKPVKTETAKLKLKLKLRRSPLSQIYQHLNAVRLPRLDPHIATPIPSAEMIMNGSLSTALSEESSLAGKEKDHSDSSADWYSRDPKISKDDAGHICSVKAKSKKRKNKNKNDKGMNENSRVTNANSKKSPKSRAQRKKPVLSVVLLPETELEESNENQVPSVMKSEPFPAPFNERTHESLKQEPLDDYSHRVVIDCGFEKSPCLDELHQNLDYKVTPSLMPSMKASNFHGNSWTHPSETSDWNFQHFTQYQASPRSSFNDIDDNPNIDSSLNNQSRGAPMASSSAPAPDYDIQTQSHNENNSPFFSNHKFCETPFRWISYDERHVQSSVQDFQIHSRVGSQESAPSLTPFNKPEEPQKFLGPPVKSDSADFNEAGRRCFMSPSAQHYLAANNHNHNNDNMMACQGSEDPAPQSIQANFDTRRRETQSSLNPRIPQHLLSSTSEHPHYHQNERVLGYAVNSSRIECDELSRPPPQNLRPLSSVTHSRMCSDECSPFYPFYRRVVVEMRKTNISRSVDSPQIQEAGLRESNARPGPVRSSDDNLLEAPWTQDLRKSKTSMTGDSSPHPSSYSYQQKQMYFNSKQQSLEFHSNDEMRRPCFDSSEYDDNYTASALTIPSSIAAKRRSLNYALDKNNYEASSPVKNTKFIEEMGVRGARTPTPTTTPAPRRMCDEESAYKSADGRILSNISVMETGMRANSGYSYSQDSGSIEQEHSPDESNLRSIIPVSTHNIHAQPLNSGKVFKRLDSLPIHQRLSQPIDDKRIRDCQPGNEQYCCDRHQNFASQQPLSTQNHFKENPGDRCAVQMNRSAKAFDERIVQYQGQLARFSPQNCNKQILNRLECSREKVGSPKVFDARKVLDGTRQYFDEGMINKGTRGTRQGLSTQNFDRNAIKSKESLSEEMKRQQDNFSPRVVSYQENIDGSYLKRGEFSTETDQEDSWKELIHQYDGHEKHEKYNKEETASQKLKEDDEYLKEEVYENDKHPNCTRRAEPTIFQGSWAHESQDMVPSLDSNQEKRMIHQEYQEQSSSSQKHNNMKTSQHFQRPGARYQVYGVYGQAHGQESFYAAQPKFAEQRVLRNPESVEPIPSWQNEMNIPFGDSEECADQQSRFGKHGITQDEESQCFKEKCMQNVLSEKNIRDGMDSREAATHEKFSQRRICNNNRNWSGEFDEEHKGFDETVVKDSRSDDKGLLHHTHELKNVERNWKSSNEELCDSLKKPDTDVKCDNIVCEGFRPHSRRLHEALQGFNKNLMKKPVGERRVESCTHSCISFQDDEHKKHSEVLFKNFTHKIAEEQKFSDEVCMSHSAANKVVDSPNCDEGALRQRLYAHVLGAQYGDKHAKDKASKFGELEESKHEKSDSCHDNDERQFETRVWRKDDEKNRHHDLEREAYANQRDLKQDHMEKSQRKNSEDLRELDCEGVKSDGGEAIEHIFKDPESSSVARSVRRGNRLSALSPAGRGSDSFNWRSRSQSRYSSSSDEDFSSLKSQNRRSRLENKSRSRPCERGYGQRLSSLPQVRLVSLDSPRSRTSSPANSDGAEIYRGYPFPRIRMENFEMFFDQHQENQRRDMIHLNGQGLGTVFNRIKEQLP